MIRRVLRRVFVRISSLFGVPEIHSRLDVLEEIAKNSDRRFSNFELYIERRTSELVTDSESQVLVELAKKTEYSEQRLEEVQSAITKLLISHTEQVANQTLSNIRREIEELAAQLARHRRYVENIQLPTPNKVEKNDVGVSTSESFVTRIDDAMYIALEDFFRGSKDLIRERQAKYLDLVRPSCEAGFPLIDLGCGRGEWLEVLRDQGIEAKGIDSNSAAVAECLSNALDVTEIDISSFLQSLPSESCGAVTMFQVLEHLPFHMLIDTLREVRRVLRPNGILIAEVPNSENLTVAASTFWIDPTHQRPLFPALLKFLALETAYAKVDGVYSSRLREVPSTTSLTSEVAEAFQQMFAALFGDADFALIAWA